MLLDAHAHLDKYGPDLPDAIREINQHRIFTIATAMDICSYLELEAIANQSPLVLSTFGIHPKRAPDYLNRMRELGPLIESSPAIGEIGLDYYWVRETENYPAQRRVLEYFLAACREQKKMVNLHTKGAEKEILNLLEHYVIERVIVHWYSGPLDVLNAFCEYGAYFTIGVELLYSETIRRIAMEIPNDRLLTETDNPGGLKWLKGIVGMPTVIKDVVRELAVVKQLTEPEMTAIIETNFLRLIHEDPWLKDARKAIAGSLDQRH